MQYAPASWTTNPDPWETNHYNQKHDNFVPGTNDIIHEGPCKPWQVLAVLYFFLGNQQTRIQALQYHRSLHPHLMEVAKQALYAVWRNISKQESINIYIITKLVEIIYNELHQGLELFTKPRGRTKGVLAPHPPILILPLTKPNGLMHPTWLIWPQRLTRIYRSGTSDLTLGLIQAEWFNIKSSSRSQNQSYLTIWQGRMSMCSSLDLISLYLYMNW
jgi:hypothetical protein